MRRLTCNAITLAAAIAIVGCACSALAWEPPRTKLRKPNDAILSEPGRDEPDARVMVSIEDRPLEDRPLEDRPRALGEPSGPSGWNASPVVPTRPPASQPRVLVLGRRDDSREATYVLEGVRGEESPAGTKSGRYATSGHERAGNPQCTSRHAQPGLDRDHSVGYVGGGTPFTWGNRGQARTTQEGTFGMDYSGWLVSRNTWLKWSHGGRHQGGAGRYETDGPRLLPEK
jgi:hypothetical protein